MSIIALANLKGGCGKTTLAVNLAGAFAPGSVLVDADPQGTATAWAEGGGLPFEVVTLREGGDVQAALLNTIAAQSAPVVIVDLPPMLGDATAAAFAVADLAVIPSGASGMDLTATSRVVSLLHQAREARGDGKPAAVMVPNRVDNRTAAGAEISGALHGYGEPVAPVVSQRVAHVDAFGSGQWIGDYAPRSPALAEIKSLAAVVRQLSGMKGAPWPARP